MSTLKGDNSCGIESVGCLDYVVLNSGLRLFQYLFSDGSVGYVDSSSNILLVDGEQVIDFHDDTIINGKDVFYQVKTKSGEWMFVNETFQKDVALNNSKDVYKLENSDAFLKDGVFQDKNGNALEIVTQNKIGKITKIIEFGKYLLVSANNGPAIAVEKKFINSVIGYNKIKSLTQNELSENLNK